MDVETKEKATEAIRERQSAVQRMRDLNSSFECADRAASFLSTDDYAEAIVQLTNAIVFLVRGVPEGTDLGDGVIESTRSGVASVVVKRGQFA